MNKPISETTAHYWAVSVELNGEIVVTIGSNHLSGRDIGPDEAAAIRTCANHLLAFIGDTDG